MLVISQPSARRCLNSRLSWVTGSAPSKPATSKSVSARHADTAGVVQRRGEAHETLHRLSLVASSGHGFESRTSVDVRRTGYSHDPAPRVVSGVRRILVLITRAEKDVVTMTGETASASWRDVRAWTRTVWPGTTCCGRVGGATAAHRAVPAPAGRDAARGDGRRARDHAAVPLVREGGVGARADLRRTPRAGDARVRQPRRHRRA